MKKFTRLFALTALFLVLGTTSVLANNVNVRLDGSYVDAEAVIVDGRTLLPARAVIEMIGGEVGWDGYRRAVEIYHEGVMIDLVIDNLRANVNGSYVELDVPPQILNGLTKVPVRFIAEALGLDVGFEHETSTVVLTSTGAPSVQLAPTAATPSGIVAATVARVIDGDTIELTTGERVRFIGVDAPEIGELGASEATEFVRGLIDGQTVWLEPDGNDADGFGRLRRYVWLQEPSDPTDEYQITSFMLNALLLSYGHADVMIVGEVRNEALFRQLSVTSEVSDPGAVSTPLPEVAPEPTAQAEIGIITAPETARRNETLTLSFQGVPNTIYTLRIVSAAGNVLTAAGLGEATSNVDGVVSWSWLVGGRTGAGTQNATILCRG